MARHTTMPPRIQKTPHGDVTLTSRWQRDRYWLMAYGPALALQWMFPKALSFERFGDAARHTFVPAPTLVTVERDLRRICARWQSHWDDQLEAGQHEMGKSEQSHPENISSVGALFDHLSALRAKEIASSTHERDKSYRKLWLRYLPAGTPLAHLTEEALVHARTCLAKETSAVTANTAMGLLKTYLSWAHNHGLMPTAFFRSIKRLKEPSTRLNHKAWWTPDDVDLALKVASKDPHPSTAVLLVAIGFYLGLRVEEAIMLRWQDLDLNAADPKTGLPKPVCHVTPHGGWTPKDGEARDIPISAPLLTILAQNRCEEGYILQAEPHNRQRPRKAIAPWAYRYDPRRLWNRLMSRLKAAGGRPITMYGMRHSFASNLLIAGVSDVKVSRWMGHADTRMIHKHYGHLLSYDDDINAISRRRPGLE